MPSPPMPSGYYNRYDEAKNFEEHLFLAGPVLQSAELNEIQRKDASRLKAIADSLFQDGDVISGAVVVVVEATGATTCASGVVYLRGAMRGVPTGSFTIPMGTVDIGIYLIDTVVDAVADPTLKDPASGLLNYQRSGADRLKTEPVWGYDGDGGEGDFYPIYTAIDRVVQPKNPPPNIDAVALAIAKYDRESTGGSYIVSGMEVTALPDSGANQVYSVAAGVARANGSEIEFGTARRLIFNPAPDLNFVDSEPHLSSGPGAQRVDVSMTPINNISAIVITKEVTETVVHGAYSGCSDALAHTSVLSISDVHQGGTTYTPTTDYLLTGNSVDWSPAGQEPNTGSSYSVTYRYVATVAPDSWDETGFTVTGAVSGTLILASYNQKMPRLDRICLAETGELIWLKGISTNYRPRPPLVPNSMLGLASIQQTWLDDRPVTNDGVKVVPMGDIARMSTRIDYVLGLVAQQRLESSAQCRATGIIKGILTDPFLDDSLRDAGVTQTGAIIDGILTLPIEVTPAFADSRDSGTISSLAYNNAVLIAQTARTGSLLVNPYDAWDEPLVPPTAVLTPSIDRWTEVIEVFKSRRTRLILNLWWWWRPGRFPGLWIGWWNGWGRWWWRTDRVTIEATIPASFLRQISVGFVLSGYTQGETLTSVTFDGVAVTPSGNGPANAQGHISGTFTIPANIPAGSKEVVFTGSAGHVATATFIGEGVVVIETTILRRRWVHWHWHHHRVDPLAETFTLEDSHQITGVDLWCTAKGSSAIEVQIRETANGVPTGSMLANARLQPASINVDGTATRFLFDAPLFLTGGVEYAIVVLSDDTVAAVAIAEMGQKDPNTNNWVTVQPYQVGVLLASSNASTWTPMQTRDLTFQLLGAAYTQTERTIALGTVAVTGATDLAVRANTELPTDVADVQFILTLPDSSTMTVVADQSVMLDAPITGNVSISAVLSGTADISPLLFADVQLLWGVIGSTGTYYSRYIQAGTAIVAKVIVEVFLPGTSTMTVEIKGDADGSWTALTNPVGVNMDDGWVELTYTSGSITKDAIATRLTLSGGTSARPAARNLRMITE